jgi:hypothetical protein
MPEAKTHEFCAGGGCCPVICQHPDRRVDIVEGGKVLVKLRPEDADSLVRLLAQLGYGVKT